MALSNLLEGKVAGGAAGLLTLPPACSDADLDAILARQATRRWHVYSKKTLRSDRAYEYLGRYARRVGLSSARIVEYDGERVTFVTKNRETTTTTVAVVPKARLPVMGPRCN